MRSLSPQELGAEIPHILGIESDHVVTANDVFRGTAVVRGRSVVVAGSGVIGVEIADFLADRGKEVTLFGRRPQIGWNIGVVTLREALERRLRDKGVKLMVNTHLEEIRGKSVIVQLWGQKRSDRSG